MDWSILLFRFFFIYTNFQLHSIIAWIVLCVCFWFGFYTRFTSGNIDLKESKGCGTQSFDLCGSIGWKLKLKIPYLLDLHCFCAELLRFWLSIDWEFRVGIFIYDRDDGFLVNSKDYYVPFCLFFVLNMKIEVGFEFEFEFGFGLLLGLNGLWINVVKNQRGETAKMIVINFRLNYCFRS